MTAATTTKTSKYGIAVLREIANLWPHGNGSLDDWQIGFVEDQVHRYEQWGDDVRLSEKQVKALERALRVMSRA
jgi:hypothetical protein